MRTTTPSHAKQLPPHHPPTRSHRPPNQSVPVVSPVVAKVRSQQSTTVVRVSPKPVNPVCSKEPSATPPLGEVSNGSAGDTHPPPMQQFNNHLRTHNQVNQVNQISPMHPVVVTLIHQPHHRVRSHPNLNNPANPRRLSLSLPLHHSRRKNKYMNPHPPTTKNVTPVFPREH